MWEIARSLVSDVVALRFPIEKSRIYRSVIVLNLSRGIEKLVAGQLRLQITSTRSFPLPRSRLHKSAMQASTSRAGLAQLTRSLALTKTLPPCTCGATILGRRSSSPAAEQTPRASPQSSARTLPVKIQQRAIYTGRSQAEKLANREERTHVVFDGMSPWVTPNDVRRLIAQRMGNANDVKEG